MIDQLGIATLGVTAVWLSQDARERVRRFACVFGLAGQPFWFYATWSGEQWGMFALCFLYTWAWLKGVRQHWVPAYRAWRQCRRERATWRWLAHLWRGRG